MHVDHWHESGHFPTVTFGDSVSIRARVEDEEDNPVDLGNDNALRVDLTGGAADIVTFDGHGVHVHNSGEETGVTKIAFSLGQGDDVQYRTPALAITVADESD